MSRLLLPNIARVTQLATRPMSQSVITTRWSPELDDAIELNTQYHINQISLAKYVNFGQLEDRHEQLIRSCQFMKTEGLIRLAHIIAEMRTLPYQFFVQTDINKVYNWYLESFRELHEAPLLASNNTVEDAEEFSLFIRQLLKRHEPTVMAITTGFRKARQTTKTDSDYYIVNYLNRFLMSRIGLRFLLNQHLALVDSEKISSSPKEWIGSIDPACDVMEVINYAARNARGICESLYYRSPSFEVANKGKNDPIVSYVPSHLYHIMFELLKNSFRAVVEAHGEEAEIPPVRIAVFKTNNDLTIKVSDEGGGIPFADVAKLFSYFYTTASPPEENLYESDMNNAPMAGFGFGLPVSRLYARYFGGDLRLVSIDSYGTDAYVFLKSVAQDATEVLPSFCPAELAYVNEKSHWVDVAHH